MSITQRRADVGMAHDLLHRHDVLTVLEKPCRDRMAEHVERNFGSEQESEEPRAD